MRDQGPKTNKTVINQLWVFTSKVMIKTYQFSEFLNFLLVMVFFGFFLVLSCFSFHLFDGFFSEPVAVWCRVVLHFFLLNRFRVFRSDGRLTRRVLLFLLFIQPTGCGAVGAVLVIFRCLGFGNTPALGTLRTVERPLVNCVAIIRVVSRGGLKWRIGGEGVYLLS